MAIAELSASASDTYIGGTFYIQWLLSGDALHQCGYICASHATNDEAIVCPVDGVPGMVCALQADLDIDTVVVDERMLAYYMLHAGTGLRVPYEETAGALFHGTAVITCVTGGVAGMVEVGTTAGVVVGYSLKVVDAAADTWVEVIT